MKIGDRVKFLNDTGGGIIIRFLDAEMALVRIEDGFEVPVRLNELIPDVLKNKDVLSKDKTEVLSGNTDKPERASQEQESIPGMLEGRNDSEQKNSGQVFLAFTHAGNPYHLMLHLINDTDYHIYYIIGLQKLGQHLFKHSGLLEANTKIELGNFRIIKTDEPTIFSVQYIGFKSGYYHPFKPVDIKIEIDTQQLVNQQYEKENDFFDQPASLFTLGTIERLENPEYGSGSYKFANNELMAEKLKPDAGRKVTEKQKSPEIMEVDLHIHEIVEDETGLTDGEILEIQLRRFEMALETALHGNVKKIVFIHGVGQGKLKYEISKTLNNKYSDLKYQDASFKEYGYGATMVLL